MVGLAPENFPQSNSLNLFFHTVAQSYRLCWQEAHKANAMPTDDPKHAKKNHQSSSPSTSTKSASLGMTASLIFAAVLAGSLVFAVTSSASSPLSPSPTSSSSSSSFSSSSSSSPPPGGAIPSSSSETSSGSSSSLTSSGAGTLVCPVLRFLRAGPSTLAD